MPDSRRQFSPWLRPLLPAIRVANRTLYEEIQASLKVERRKKTWRKFESRGPIVQLPLPGGGGTFKHSGNAGDVIYALPSLRAVCQGRPAHLRLALGVPMHSFHPNHPLGGVMLDQAMADLLKPLLLAQDYIASVGVHAGGPVDFDLDRFRASPLQLNQVNICRWYFSFLGVACDLSVPWLKVEPDTRFAGQIVLARSFRYRNECLDYSFLQEFDNVRFVGIESEFLGMRRLLPKLDWVRVPDFLQLARVIAGSRLFIGNQSLPFALAEGLKVTRILETNPTGADVVPAGANGYDVLFQKQFVHLVRRLNQG